MTEQSKNMTTPSLEESKAMTPPNLEESKANATLSLEESANVVAEVGQAISVRDGAAAAVEGVSSAKAKSNAAPNGMGGKRKLRGAKSFAGRRGRWRNPVNFGPAMWPNFLGAPGTPPVEDANYLSKSPLCLLPSGWHFKDSGPSSLNTGGMNTAQKGSFGFLSTQRGAGGGRGIPFSGLSALEGFQQQTATASSFLGLESSVYGSNSSPALTAIPTGQRNYKGNTWELPPYCDPFAVAVGNSGGDVRGVNSLDGALETMGTGNTGLNQFGGSTSGGVSNLNYDAKDFVPLGSGIWNNPSPANSGERFSRKVFVGGLPPDIVEDEILMSFQPFGPLIVDWPAKTVSKSSFPPKGYAFLIFRNEASVHRLVNACYPGRNNKLYLLVSSPSTRDKPVQVKAWKISDAEFVLYPGVSMDPRKTVFIGGVPRPVSALDLATFMNNLFGGVCYAGIDTDLYLKYPKGAGRVTFSNQESYVAAIAQRTIKFQLDGIDKKVEVKPYVRDDQFCDQCGGLRSGGKYARLFCPHVSCLKYYCDQCWRLNHFLPGKQSHVPVEKDGAFKPGQPRLQFRRNF